MSKVKDLPEAFENAVKFLQDYLGDNDIRRAELVVIVGGRDGSGGGQHIHVSLLGKCTACEECLSKS